MFLYKSAYTTLFDGFAHSAETDADGGSETALMVAMGVSIVLGVGLFVGDEKLKVSATNSRAGGLGNVKNSNLISVTRHFAGLIATIRV